MFNNQIKIFPKIPLPDLVHAVVNDRFMRHVYAYGQYRNRLLERGVLIIKRLFWIIYHLSYECYKACI